MDDTQNESRQKTLELVKTWFEHIAQMACDRKTANGAVMDRAQALAEINVLAKEAAEYVKSNLK